MTFFLDELDIFLIYEIYKRDETTTWKITKKYYGIVPKSEEDYRNVYDKLQLVKFRLKKLSKMNLVSITKEPKTNKNIYHLILKNVKVGTHKFPDKKAKAVYLRLNNKWQIFEV